MSSSLNIIFFLKSLTVTLSFYVLIFTHRFHSPPLRDIFELKVNLVTLILWAWQYTVFAPVSGA